LFFNDKKNIAFLLVLGQKMDFLAQIFFEIWVIEGALSCGAMGGYVFGFFSVRKRQKTLLFRRFLQTINAYFVSKSISFIFLQFLA
jgi:hypothetical protein